MSKRLNKVASAFLAAALAAALAPAPAASAAVAAAESGALAAQGAPKQAQAAAKKKAISKEMVTAKNLAYTGKAQKAKVTVKSGKRTLKAGRDYTLAVRTAKGKKVAGNKVKAKGAYKAVVKGKGAYKGTVAKSFKVVAKKRAKVKLTASMVSVRNLTKAIGWDGWNGNSAYGPRCHDTNQWAGQNADVTVKRNGKALKRGTDYTVTRAYATKCRDGKCDKNGRLRYVRRATDGNVVWEPATYVAYVTGKGAYTGTVCKAFKLAPETKKVGGVTYTKQSIYKSVEVQKPVTSTYYDRWTGEEYTTTYITTVVERQWRDRWVRYDAAEEERQQARGAMGGCWLGKSLPYTKAS